MRRFIICALLTILALSSCKEVPRAEESKPLFEEDGFTDEPSPVSTPPTEPSIGESVPIEPLQTDNDEDQTDFNLEDFYGVYRVVELAWDGVYIDAGRLENSIDPASAIGFEVEFTEDFCRVGDSVMAVSEYNVSTQDIDRNGVIYSVAFWTSYVGLASRMDLTEKYRNRWDQFDPVYNVSINSDDYNAIIKNEYYRKHYEEMVSYADVIDENHIMLYDAAWSLLAVRDTHLEDCAYVDLKQ